MAKVCDDCGTVEGNVHEAFCTRELCHFCENQLISCSCISEILELDPEEQKAVDNYEDDSTEPLAGIFRRWVKVPIAKAVFHFNASLNRPNLTLLTPLAKAVDLRK